MLRNIQYAPGFGQSCRATGPAGRSSRRPASLSWLAVTGLRTICDAFREGLAAHRRYKDLRSRGMPHETAVQQAVGVGPSASPAIRERATLLCFAGQA